MQNVLKQFEEKDTALLSGQFSHARIELTLIYAIILAAIIGISSIITYSLFSSRLDMRWAQYRLPPRIISIKEDNFPDEARSELALTLFAVNGVLLAGAIGLSYILAGITLHPIQQAYEKQRRFLSDASHELRTPLAILQTDLENELSEKHITSETKEQITSHLEEVQRMGSIVKDLLLMSRLDTENSTTTPIESVDFTALAVATIHRLTPYAEKNNITLTSKLPGLPIIIQAHAEHISQAIMNLIKNGIDYNTPNGSVTISMNIEKSTATLIVADTGVGISKENLAKIFDRFYRIDESRTRTTGGSGLGLSIVQSIAKTYGGSVEITSDGTHGSTAHLSFPLKEAS